MWKGPSNGADRQGVTLLDWTALGSGDGMFTQVDPEDSRWLHTTMQNGGHFRVDQKLGYRTSILPRREKGQPPYRFIWCPPLHISPHNSRILYAGAQVLLRSLDRGDHWQEISPDLTTNDTAKMIGSSEGGIPWFAISTVSESPLTPGFIWVGTSDGKVWITKNHGATWTDLTQKIADLGAPKDYYVSRVSASHFREGTAYVTKTGYRNDDFRPFIFKTEDSGATWASLAANLPQSAVNVIIEGGKNPGLIFLGNDAGVHVSIDGGKKWVRMNNNIPNVPVNDLLVHPRENDLIVATYGRGLYVTDITPLQEMNEKTLGEEIYFFEVEPRAQRVSRNFGANDYLFGDRHLITPNEPNGLAINYYLKNGVKGKVNIRITDLSGQEITRLDGRSDAGVNAVVWDMRRRIERREDAARMRNSSDVLTQWVPPGEYLIILEIDEKKIQRRARITRTIGWSLGPFPEKIR
jgi:hypothetical protein